jgi:sterol desaturase/sphingolipid hydroxylase (fatty acid hydroxylase superfamily)
MSPVDAITLLVPLSFFGLLALEAVLPKRMAMPERRGWRFVGLGFFVLMAVIQGAGPLLVPAWMIERYRLLDLSWLGPIGGFVVGWSLYTLVGYVWHRANHSLPWLWRRFHQMHHAPKRLDIASATIFHPAEMIAYTVIGLIVTVFVLGLDPIAAALIGAWGAFVGIFQHMNVRTPRWIGPLVQRPESHGLHHDVHGPAGNYADLPLWDVLFGTYHNPETFEGEVGFRGGNDGRWLEMLAFKDVSNGAMGQPAHTPVEV